MADEQEQQQQPATTVATSESSRSESSRSESARSEPSRSESPRSESRGWLWAVIGGGAFFLFALAVFTLVYLSARSGGPGEGGGGWGDKIAVVDIEGVIITPKDVVRELKRFGDDQSVKAIVLHINTPGGGAAASEEIYREVRRIRDVKKKRIVASIETVGASGGYYIASGTNKIYAMNASVVGSIGVIAEWYNYGDLLRWAKLKEVVVKAGEFKDIGDPAREMTPAERALLQTMIDNMHGQFIAAVASGRGLKVEDIKPIATGQVWTGEQAVPLKLVDQIADFREAVEDTAKAVGIKGEPNLVRVQREKRSVLDLLLGDATDLLPPKVMDNQVGFYYLWKLGR